LDCSGSCDFWAIYSVTLTSASGKNAELSVPVRMTAEANEDDDSRVCVYVFVIKDHTGLVARLQGYSELNMTTFTPEVTVICM